MRLNRYLSSCGLGSRRGCEQLVRDGRVIVNGKTCTTLSTTVAPEDEVVVDGNRVQPHKGVVIVVHKPPGLVCSRRDERDRDTIYKLLPEKFHVLHHVGRLDKESEGLLLMTNRGEVSQRLMHPSQGVEKEYEVVVETRFDPENLTRLTKGFHTEDGFLKAERAWMIGDFKVGIVLKQGLKRQIRLMLYFLGYEVKRLIRVRIGNLGIKGLPEGAWKELSDRDVEKYLINPVAKDRPKMSKPKTASVRKSLETHRQKMEKRSRSPRKQSGGKGKAPYSSSSSSSSSDSRSEESAPRSSSRPGTRSRPGRDSVGAGEKFSGSGKKGDNKSSSRTGSGRSTTGRTRITRAAGPSLDRPERPARGPAKKSPGAGKGLGSGSGSGSGSARGARRPRA